jgi:hypothetical protein
VGQPVLLGDGHRVRETVGGPPDDLEGSLRRIVGATALTMLTICGPNEATPSMNVTQTPMTSRSISAAPIFPPRKIASRSVMDAKISLMMTMLRGVAAVRMRGS